MLRALVRAPAVRFVVVGLAMTVLHLVVFGLLEPYTVPEVANVVAFVCVTQVNFAISYSWTWSSRRPAGRQSDGSLLRRAVLFTGSASVGFAINATVFSTAHRLAGLTPFQSAVVATAAGAAAAFLLSSRVVFPAPRRREGAHAPTAETSAVELPGRATAGELLSPSAPSYTTRGSHTRAQVEA